MMEGIKDKKAIFIAVAAIAAVFLFMNLSGSSQGPTAIKTVSTDIADQQMVRMLRTVQKITLDTSIFSDPAFQSLKDFSRAIEKEPQSRRNPFVPPELEPEEGLGGDTTGLPQAQGATGL